MNTHLLNAKGIITSHYRAIKIHTLVYFKIANYTFFCTFLTLSIPNYPNRYNLIKKVQLFFEYIFYLLFCFSGQNNSIIIKISIEKIQYN